MRPAGNVLSQAHRRTWRVFRFETEKIGKHSKSYANAECVPKKLKKYYGNARCVSVDGRFVIRNDGSGGCPPPLFALSCHSPDFPDWDKRKEKRKEKEDQF